MIVGTTGDMLRGATPINLPAPLEFGDNALGVAMVENPEITQFIVYVNPFKRFIAQRIVDRYNGESVNFKVHTDEVYAKDSWRIEPVE